MEYMFQKDFPAILTDGIGNLHTVSSSGCPSVKVASTTCPQICPRSIAMYLLTITTIASTYLCAVLQSLLRGDETHLAVALACHQDHALGLDAADLARCKIGKDAYLLA